MSNIRFRATFTKLPFFATSACFAYKEHAAAIGKTIAISSLQEKVVRQATV
jgi:hypothetical protein